MGKKSIIIAVIIAVAAFVHPLYAKGNFDSLQCDVVKGDKEISITMKLFIKGNKWRTESPSMFVLYNGKMQYIYYPTQNTAVAMPLSAEEVLYGINKAFGLPRVNEKEIGKKLLRQERIEGRECDVYEISYQGNTVTEWVAKDLDFPIKIEQGDFFTLYTNIRVNTPLDDSLFELPSGVQVTEISNEQAQYIKQQTEAKQ